MSDINMTPLVDVMLVLVVIFIITAPLLATVGSTAPFVGLLGTVWGIYHALAGIASSGQITIDKVAGPVGEALIMTAAGLAVAIPAVLGYNVFGRLIGRIEADLEGFARDLRELLTHPAGERRELGEHRWAAPRCEGPLRGQRRTRSDKRGGSIAWHSVVSNAPRGPSP